MRCIKNFWIIKRKMIFLFALATFACEPYEYEYEYPDNNDEINQVEVDNKLGKFYGKGDFIQYYMVTGDIQSELKQEDCNVTISNYDSDYYKLYLLFPGQVDLTLYILKTNHKIKDASHSNYTHQGTVSLSGTNCSGKLTKYVEGTTQKSSYFSWNCSK